MRNRSPITALLLALAAGVAPADTPVRMLTADLRLQRAHLIELDENTAVVRAADAPPTRVALASLVAITAGGPGQLPTFAGVPGASRVFIELTDGQRLVVDIGPSQDPEAVIGRVVGLGQGRIPLQRIARIARPGAAWQAGTPTADIVRLTNGDVLTGFVDSIGATVSVESDSGVAARIPIDRVAEIRLANPAEPAPGLLVTDDQGVTLFARSVGVDESGRVRITTDPGVLGVDSRGEDTIAYERPGARLMGLRTAAGATRRAPVLPLAVRTPETVRPTGERRWTPAPVTDRDDDPVLAIPDIRMPAPAESVYPLAPGSGADRFACEVAPSDPGPWTDCTARVWALAADGTRTLIGEQRITAGTVNAPIAGAVPPGTRAIVLEVDPGVSGAVQDAVTFIAPRVRTNG